MLLRQARILISLLLLVVGLVVVGAFGTQSTSAVTGSEFRAGRIIDDVIFFNKDAMGVAQIQAFLNAKVPICDRWRASSNPSYQPPYTCLREYQENTGTGESNYGRFNPDGSPYQVPGGKSAAQIIWEEAQNYSINPQTLLVMLQKEQSLVTDDWPWLIQYQKAMGQSCPDTAPCDPAFAGFYRQVSGAAWQLRHYVNNPQYFNYRSNVTRFVLYSPNQACGGTNVFIENQATAALYNYTPYQPNQAALNNLYGTGDGCSAYGNRNFWRMFNDWFGLTTTSARVVMMPTDPTTDNTGKAARIKVRLNQPISSPVTIPLSISNPEMGAFATPSTITIHPEDWNNPDKNVIVIRGLGVTGQDGVLRYSLTTGSPQTNDPNFRLLTGDYVDDVNLTHLYSQNTRVYRLFSSTTGRHIYTASEEEKQDLTSSGYASDGIAFYYCRAGETPIYRFRKSGDDSSKMLYQEGPAVATAIQEGFSYDYPLFATSRGASVPVYTLNHPTGNTFYTTSAAERDYVIANHNYIDNGIGFYVCGEDQQPVYRMRSTGNNNHFFTTSAQERDLAGSYKYMHEGVGFYTCNSGNTDQVYRLYSHTMGKHFYTTSTQERDLAITRGYSNEGVGFSVCSGSAGLMVKRLYNAVIAKHMFTPSLGESQSLLSNGFVDEGLLFYSNP